MVFGVAEAAQGDYLAAAVASVGATGLIIGVWFLNALKNVAQKAADKWFVDMVGLPAQVAETAGQVGNLTETLEKFATDWEQDRKESHAFRLALATTLAEHGTTIKAHGEQLASIRTWPPRA